MNLTNLESIKDFVTSTDGTRISYTIMGQGPGLLIIHGGFRASQHYQRLANSLADSFTVYLIDRRGRNDSGPKGSDYSIQKECEDAIAILKKHQIPYLFGHSFGGLVSLNVGLQYPLTKLAIYEAGGISKDNPFPTAWLSQFDVEIQKQDYVAAMITFLKGLKMGGIIKLPKPVLKVLFSSMTKAPDWEANKILLGELSEEIKASMKFASQVETYQKISAKTLVMTGTKTPDYILSDAQELMAILPDGQRISLEGLDHSAPDQKAPEKVGQQLKAFYKG